MWLVQTAAALVWEGRIALNAGAVLNKDRVSDDI